MNIAPNTFCWHGIATDMDAGTCFYPQVLGWSLVDTDDGPMFVAPGGAVSHIQPPQGPPAWCSYLSVDDLDARTAQAGEAGTVLVPPTDLNSGRFSIVMSPTGAVFGLYAATASDALPAPGPGSVHRVELQSTAPDADLAWLSAVFGLAHRAEAAGYTLEADGEARGGVTQTEGDRSVVVAWVEVADLDETLGRLRQHGGALVSRAGGRALVADPGGARFGLVQLSR